MITKQDLIDIRQECLTHSHCTRACELYDFHNGICIFLNHPDIWTDEVINSMQLEDN